MKRLLFTGAMLLIFLCSANAQGKIGVGVYGGTSVPAGDFNTLYNPAYQANASFNFMYRSNIQISFLTGYIQWNLDNTALNEAFHEEGFAGTLNLDSPITGIPVIIQAKYFLGSFKYRPYILAEAGIYALRQTFKGTYEVGGTVTQLEEEEYKSTETTFGLGAGVLIPVTSKIAVDINARYSFINDSEIISEQNSQGNAGTASLSTKTINVINITGGINYYF